MNIKKAIFYIKRCHFSQKLKPLIIHVILPLSLGCFIYFFGRETNNLFFESIIKIPFLHKISLPKWVIFNLQDGLWLYSFLMWMFIIWEYKQSKYALFWYLSIIVLAFGSEILQKYQPSMGTFDWIDILTYVLAVIFCINNFNTFNSKQ